MLRKIQQLVENASNHTITKWVFQIALLCLTIYGLFLSAAPVLHNDLGYNTDIARDFLVMQNVVTTHKIPLIGPHTGGISGLFHGPLWYYINLPAFIIGHGNPVVIGWFWILLIICVLGVTFYVSTKIFNPLVGSLSIALLSLALVGSSSSFLNPFGAAIFSPLFFYLFYKYIKSCNVVYLLSTFFIIGLMIQFEVAFGGPMLILSIAYLLPFLFKKRKLPHFLSVFILLIPLSTYILFDLRHNFLQLHSVISHVGSPTGNGKETLREILQNRWNGAVTSVMSLPYAPLWVSLGVLLYFLYLAFYSRWQQKLKNREFYLLFMFFYIGYWPLSFYLNGDVLGIHIFPFIPIAVIVLSASYLFVKKLIFIPIFLLIIFFNLRFDLAVANGITQSTGKAGDSWKFNYQLAQTVFHLAPGQFGYYVFSTDEFGYGPKYAIEYAAQQYQDKTAYQNSKKHITFVILSAQEGAPNNNRDWWIKNRVKITDVPIRILTYGNGYEIREYALSESEMRIPSDPNLVKDLFFR